MTTHLLLTGTAETDQPALVIPDCENQAVADAVDPPKGAIADFAIIIPVIDTDRGLGIETGEVTQPQPVLGKILGILRRVKVDLHPIYVAALNTPRKVIGKEAA